MSPNEEIEAIVEGQVFHQTRNVGDENLYVVQLPYNLEQVEFIHLKDKNPWSDRIATLFSRFFIGYAILITGKLGYYLYTQDSKPKPLRSIIEGWEIWVLILAGILTGLAYGIAYILNVCIPSEKRKVIDRIEDHYRENPGFPVIGRRH